MSQAAVEQVIGRMLLDPGFRNQMASDRQRALSGFDLTEQERAGLDNVDLADFDRTITGLDARVSKGIEAQ